MYTQHQRDVQDTFDSRRLADRIEERLVQSELDADDKAFIERQMMFFLATADEQGHLNCSFKGGPRGFVRVLDANTLAFPDYNGNGMFLSIGNIRGNAEVGLLFIDFEQPKRLRVNGEASIDPNDPLLAEFTGAQLVVRVSVREAFPNCPRYIPRMQLVEESRFVQRVGEEAPIPDWKRSDWACDVLPRSDVDSS
ncbi:MAG: pyridoxamine 5'-phosphate oxidase family protein [Methanoregulaceae archaeon]|nr:pyridoxamine 5'-phosphate oxidase family protein [Methanoregulaceae archaeon]